MGQLSSSSRDHGASKIILITGCSDGGLGAALATAFHEAGHAVYATARDISKMNSLSVLGIKTLELDVTSSLSIATCVDQIPHLDVLVNNAAVMLTMTAADVSILEAKKLFDTNLWGTVEMCQAFLPLLIKSKGMIVNHTSIGSILPMPGAAAYAASKAAIAMYSAILRMEVEGFGVQVVDLKTGAVGPTNLIDNNYTRRTLGPDHPVLPSTSCYRSAKEIIEPILRHDNLDIEGMPPATWAKLVLKDLLNTRYPPPLIFRGYFVIIAKLSLWLPFGAMNSLMKRSTKFDQVEEVLRHRA